MFCYLSDEKNSARLRAFVKIFNRFADALTFKSTVMKAFAVIFRKASAAIELFRGLIVKEADFRNKYDDFYF